MRSSFESTSIVTVALVSSESAEEDKDTLGKCAVIIRDPGVTQTKMTSTYFTEGEKLKSAVIKLQESWMDQMETEHHIKEGVGNSTFVLSVENDNDFRSRCE